MHDGLAAAILASEALAPFVSDQAVRWIGDGDPTIDSDGPVVSYRLLQDVADYRSALRDWFEQVRRAAT